MLFILLIVSILIYDLLRRIHEFAVESSCISMFSFKNKNYLEKFDEIYKNVTEEFDSIIKPLRKRCMAIFLFKGVTYICGIWILLSGILLAITKTVVGGIFFSGISMFLFAGAVFSEKYANLFFAEYLETYKDKIINNYIRKINKGFGYSLRGFIDDKIFKDSFDSDIDVNHYYGCDYVTGVVEGTRTLNLCELYVKYKENKKKRIFCGLFAYLKTDYNDEMKVECINKNISYKNIPLNMQVVIEKFIKEFEAKQNVDFKLLVRNGKIFIKIYCGDILRPTIFFDKINKERLWAYYLLLKFSVDLTSLMNTVRIIK